MKLHHNQKSGYRILLFHPQFRLFWLLSIRALALGLRMGPIALEASANPVTIEFEIRRDAGGFTSHHGGAFVWPWLWLLSLWYREWPLWIW